MYCYTYYCYYYYCCCYYYYYLYYKTVCVRVCLSVSLCLFPNICVSFGRMLLTFYRRAPGPIGMFLKKSWGGNFTKELMWAFGAIVFRSYGQLFATLGVFSTIVPSYMIYVKCRYQFLREIDIGTCFGGMKLYLSLHWHCPTKT